MLNNYEVDPKYFIEKYNMPVGERRTVQPVTVPQQPKEEDNKDYSVVKTFRFLPSSLTGGGCFEERNLRDGIYS